VAADLLERAAELLVRRVAAHPHCRVLRNSAVKGMGLRTGPGCQRVSLYVARKKGEDAKENAPPPGGPKAALQMLELRAAHVVLANGAKLHQPAWANRFLDTLVPSGLLQTRQGLRELRRRLRRAAAARVVLVGGSHSAFSTARLLLDLQSELLGSRTLEVCIVHRSPLKVYYRSEAEARQDGYTDYPPDAVCRATGQVHVFSGLQMEAKQLFQRVRDGCAPVADANPPQAGGAGADDAAARPHV
jgi:hypothetical protein